MIGGFALRSLGLIDRATRDVDVLALGGSGGPADVLRLGLPVGFEGRLVSVVVGPNLTVHLAGRVDQIHFKLYAMVDQGAGRHEADLRALTPTSSELREAAAWASTHDPSDGFRQELDAVLRYLEANDVAHDH